MPAKRKVRYLRLLLPLLLLLLSVLACDDGPLIPQVYAVIADEQPGRAYIQVVNSDRIKVGMAYQTDDYGKTWHLVENAPIEFPSQPPRQYDLAMWGEQLVEKNSGQELWSFPRSGFRSFFHADTSGQRFALPYSDVSNSANGDTLYIAMGSEGVLVAHFTDDLRDWATVQWSLESSGINAINPIGLTLTEPTSIALVVLLALIAPPLVLIHQVVLKWVWSYVLREEEAARWAFNTTVLITAFAILAIIIWLTDMRTDYYPVLGVMTLVVVAIGLIAAYRLSQQVDSGVRLRVLIVTALVSLIVPASLSVGTGAAITSWPLAILLIWGFSTYRRLYQREYGLFLARSMHPRPRWTVDRLALETVILGTVLVAICFGTLTYGRTILYDWFGYEFYDIIMWALLAFYAFFAVRALKWYIDGAAIKLFDYDYKSDDPPISMKLMGWSGHIQAAGLWWLGALIFAAATFFVQMVAYGWFQNMAL